jgi:lysine 2,3-aminomutase
MRRVCKDGLRNPKTEIAMTEIEVLDKIAISVKSHKLLKQLLKENPRLEEIMRSSRNETEALVGVRNWVLEVMKDRPAALRFRKSERPTREEFEALEWWKDKDFHLRFAVRSPEMLNELLGNSLDPDTMKILYQARDKGIPFFVNPYYLSLLHVRVPYFAIGADLAIRHYVVYSRELVDEFGHIVAWEKEDQVEAGKPNAAGWILPSQKNVHRRYPDVAILIPDTMGRACPDPRRFP